jgi:hypothetical protein
MKYASATLESSEALPPVDCMTPAEVQDELRRVSGTPWQSDADGPRREALWKRLDILAAEGRVNSKPSPAASPPSAKARPPDLQTLVARFGGYDKIPPEAWAEHDRAMDEYHIMRRIIPRR